MTRREAFTRDDVKRTQLEAALPVVLEALGVLKDELEASRLVDDPVTVNPQVGNNYYQQSMGIMHGIRELSGLTRHREGVKTPEPRRQFTEADREVLETKGGK